MKTIDELQLENDALRAELAAMRRSLCLLDDIIDGKAEPTGNEPENIQGTVDRVAALKRELAAMRAAPTDEDITIAINELCEAAYAFAISDPRVDVDKCAHAKLELEKQKALQDLIARKVAAARSRPS